MNGSNYPQLPVLLVDDEQQFLLSAGFTLNSLGITNLEECADSREALQLIQQRNFSVVVLDINMPHLSGKDLLREIHNRAPQTAVIMLTAINEVAVAVDCMQAGAMDYLVKPVDDQALFRSVQRAIDHWQMRDENVRLKDKLLHPGIRNPKLFESIVTQDAAMQNLFQYIEAIGPTPYPVLIQGETGTGKELFARAVHDASGRSGAFVALNVAGVDDNLFSDTLFGHRKGAFTGALQDRKGMIGQATGGTLFLDEIGDLSLDSQVKLLRLLQEGQYYEVGADRPLQSDARIVVASNQNLQQKQKDGSFRQDLFYRLQAHAFTIPPLRDRKSDLQTLIPYFVSRSAKELHKPVPALPPELFTLLSAYHFPGNVRELEGLLADAVSRHQSGVLSIEALRQRLFPQGKPETEADDLPGKLHFPEVLPHLKQAEDELIKEALRRAQGNQRIAAELLGISRRALNNRLQRKQD